MKQMLLLFSIVFFVGSCVDPQKADNRSVAEVSSKNATVDLKQSDDCLIDHKDAVEYITMFMNNTYFNQTAESEEWAKEYLTERMASYLEEMYLTEADSVEGHHYIADWAFRISPEMETKLQSKENMTIFHHKDNWYVVLFGKDKRTQKNSYLLKIVKEGNNLKIDNIINEGMGFDGIPEK